MRKTLTRNSYQILSDLIVHGPQMLYDLHKGSAQALVDSGLAEKFRADDGMCTLRVHLAVTPLGREHATYRGARNPELVAHLLQSTVTPQPDGSVLVGGNTSYPSIDDIPLPPPTRRATVTPAELAILKQQITEEVEAAIRALAVKLGVALDTE